MENLIFNADFRIWGNGTNARPTGWQISTNVSGGSAPAIARQTSGRVSAYKAELTRQNANAFLAQNVHSGVLPGAPHIDEMVGKWLTYAALIDFDQHMVSGSRDFATMCAPTLSDGVYETHADMHRGYGEHRLCIGYHLVKPGATQIAFNALTVKNQTYDAAGVFSARVHWAGLFVGRHAPEGIELPVRYAGRKESLHFGADPSITLANGSTGYLGHGLAQASMGQGPDHVALLLPYNCVIRKLFARASAQPGSGQSNTYSLQLGNTVTALTASATNASQGVCNNSVEVYGQENQQACIKIETTAGAAPANHVVTVEIEEVPIS
jgi:hypothetical protein